MYTEYSNDCCILGVHKSNDTRERTRLSESFSQTAHAKAYGTGRRRVSLPPGAGGCTLRTAEKVGAFDLRQVNDPSRNTNTRIKSLKPTGFKTLDSETNFVCCICLLKLLKSLFLHLRTVRRYVQRGSTEEMYTVHVALTPPPGLYTRNASLKTRRKVNRERNNRDTIAHTSVGF